MQTGKRNKQIVIESQTMARGAAGGMKPTWSPVREPWAAVRNLSGNERAGTAQGGQMAEARTEFDISYRPGTTTDMRVRYGGRIYNIRHVNDVMEKHESLVLTCDTGASDG